MSGMAPVRKIIRLLLPTTMRARRGALRNK
jgi:hypothetical protein